MATAGVVLAITAWAIVGGIQLRAAREQQEKDQEIARTRLRVHQEEERRTSDLAQADQNQRDKLAAVDDELREKRRLSSADLRRRALALCQEQRCDQGLVLLAEALQVASRSDEGQAHEVLLDLAQWDRQVFPLRLVLPKGHEVSGFSPDGRVVVTLQAKEENRHPSVALVRRYGLDSGRWLGKAVPHDNGSTGLPWFVGAISPDGKTLLTRTFEKNADLQLWHADTGEPVGPPLEGKTFIHLFSPDSKTLLSGRGRAGTQELRFWDTTTGQARGDPIRPGLAGLSETLTWIKEWLPERVKLPRLDFPLKGTAFSPDSRVVLTHCATTGGSAQLHVLELWDSASSQKIGPPLCFSAPWSRPGQGRKQARFAFSPDGQRVAIITEPARVQLYDTAAFQPVGAPLLHDQTVRAMGFLAVPPVLVVHCGEDSAGLPRDREPAGPSVYVWEVRPNQEVRAPLRRSEYPGLKEISPDLRRVLTADGDASLRLWDVVTGKPIGAPIPADSEGAVSTLFSPEGRWLLVNRRTAPGRERLGRLYNTATGQPLGQLLVNQGHDGACRFGPDGRSLTISDVGAMTTLRDVTPRLPLVLKRHPLMMPGLWNDQDVLAFSPDGKKIVPVDPKGSLRWDALTGEPIPDAPPKAAGSGQIAGPGQLPGRSRTVSPDGKWAIVMRDDQRELQVHRVATDRPVGPAIPCTWQRRVLFQPDSRRAVVCHDNEASLLEFTDTAVTVKVLPHHAVETAAFSPDGRFVATAGGVNDGNARLWDATTGKLVRERMTHDSFNWQHGINEISFSPTGRFLLTGRDRRYLIWDTRTGKTFGPGPIRKPGSVDRQQEIHRVRFVPDDRIVLTAVAHPQQGWTVQFWDGNTGEALGESIRPVPAPRSQANGSSLALAFTPDGESMLVGQGTSAQLYDTRTARRLGLPLVVRGEIKSVAFSPGGRRVLVVCQQDTISPPELSIWPTPDRYPGDPAGIKAHVQAATGLELAADGKVIKVEAGPR